MKKFVIVALVCLLDTIGAFAQTGVNVGPKRYVHDTTFVTLSIDTTAGVSTAGHTIIWSFGDGSADTGSVIVYAATDLYAGSFGWVSVSGAVYNWSDYFDFGPLTILNCAVLSTVSLGMDYFQPNLSIANDAQLRAVDFDFSYSYPADTNLKMRMNIDWGNTHTVCDTLTPVNWPVQIGGLNDLQHSAGYVYSGLYKVVVSFNYFIDTVTCPVLDLDPYFIQVGGSLAHPVMVGSFTYCAGDTMGISPIDTTAVFHNLYHSNFLGSGSYYLPFNHPDILVADSAHTTYQISWYDQYFNQVSLDSFLSRNNLTPFDSGIYRLRIIEGLSGIDTEFDIHVTVTGSLIALDSVTYPSCGFNNGTIWLNCFRAGDSVAVTYLANGIPTSVSGRTNAIGRIAITALPQGTYSDIRVRFIGDACASNRLGPVVMPLPVTLADTIMHSCYGSAVSLSCGITGTTFLWQGPGGFTSTAEHPVVPASGNTVSCSYSVMVGNGCTNTFRTVNSNVVRATSFAPHYADTICQNDYVPLHYNSSVEPFIYSSVACSDTSIISGRRGIAAGSATLIYSLTNVCGTGSYTQDIFVRAKPVLPPISGPGPLCGGDTASFQIAATGGRWFVDAMVGAGTVGDVGPGASSHLNIVCTAGTNTTVFYQKRDNYGCKAYVSKPLQAGLAAYFPFYFGSLGLGLNDTITLRALVFGESVLSHIYSSSADSIVTVDSNGLLKGLDTGSAWITYAATGACGTVTTKTAVFVTDWVRTVEVGGGAVNTLAVDHPVPALSCSFPAQPVDVAKDELGNVYIVDLNSTIYKMDTNRMVSVLNGDFERFSGSLYDGYAAGTGPAMPFDAPNSIIADRAGNVFVSTRAAIVKVDHSGHTTHVAGMRDMNTFYRYYVGVQPYSGEGGPAINARINVGSIAADTNGNIYFTDPYLNQVRRVDAGTGVITTIAGNGTYGYSGDSGPATAASIGGPLGIAIDNSGNVLVTTAGYVRKIDASGIITTIAGLAGGDSTGTAPASAEAPVFYGILKVAANGDIFVSGSFASGYYFYSDAFYDGWGTIKKIDVNGRVRTVAGGQANYYWQYAYYSQSFPYAGIHFVPDDSGGIYTTNRAQNELLRDGPPYLKLKASSDSICGAAHSIITYTAQTRYVGNTPFYQWQKNGISVGGNSSVYTDSSIASTDTVVCKVYYSSGGRYLATATKVVAIDSLAPVPPVVSGPSDLCAGVSATLSATVPGGVWSSTAGAVVTGSSVVGVSAGAVVLTYTVTNACGSAMDTMLLQVHSQPDTAAITGPGDVCLSSTVTLSAGASGGTWSSSSSDVSVVAGVATGVSVGAAVVSYTISNSCGTAVDTMLVTVHPLPFAGTITGSNTLCLPSSVTLADTTTGGTWSSSNGNVSVSGGVVTGIAAGTSVISYSVTNSCGTAVDTMQVSVSPVPEAGTITGSNMVCQLASVTLTNSAVGGTWSSSNANVSVSGGVVTGITLGTSIISFNVTNSCGSATDTFLITVAPLPYAGVLSGSHDVCQASSVTLSASVAGGTWSSTSINTTVDGGIVSGVNAGLSYILYSVTNSCGTSVDTFAITVSPQPAACTITGEDTVCEGSNTMLVASVSGGLWSSSIPRLGIIHPSGMFNAEGTGNVVISYQVGNGCGSAVVSHNIYMLPGGECGSLGAGSLFSIWPNPTTGALIVELPASDKNTVIAIAEVSGRIVKTVRPQSAGLQVPLNVSELAHGVYMISVETSGHLYHQKIVLW